MRWSGRARRDVHHSLFLCRMEMSSLGAGGRTIKGGEHWAGKKCSEREKEKEEESAIQVSFPFQRFYDLGDTA